ncbi:sigma-54 interaction domain-containing protein [Metabacillus herbersteinensis]|uniref:Sigma-54 interaction domain-containing protein n=1 Tax=Metabacillus herbersteinensis TaxID=283816 RepID=A0ABV6GKV6_9BACI
MQSFTNKEELFKSILNSVDEGIHAVDQDGITIFYNKVAANHDGLAINEVVGQHLLTIFPSLTEETSTLLKVIKTKRPIFDLPQRYMNIRGEIIETVNSTVPIMINETFIGAVEIAKDYSTIKKLSEKLLDLQRRISKGKSPSSSQSKTLYRFKDIISADPQLIQMKSLAKKVSGSHANVLIFGETGTGKELFVQAIHQESPRSHAPFIAQNCAALPENLLESLLFGTAKGSFTGAIDRAGLFELANGGTLFLDELQATPLLLQAKLLRVIEDGWIRRVGSEKQIQVDVRILAAMNEEPVKCVEKKQLREDLFFRLNVFLFNIPPLNKRTGDVSLLTDHFISYYNNKLNKKIKGLSDNALHVLKNHLWPGNVRELKHVIEYAVTIEEGDTIELTSLPVHFQAHIHQSNHEFSPLKETLQNFEKDYIEKALHTCNGNVVRTATLLKIPRQTLQYKIKKLNL